MRDVYRLNRLVQRYENLFRNRLSDVKEESDFHIDQLKRAIECTDSVLEIVGEEINDWSEAVQEVYEVDDANTPWKKFQLMLMKWYVNKRYEQVLNEAVSVGKAKEKFEVFLKRLEILKCFK